MTHKPDVAGLHGLTTIFSWRSHTQGLEHDRGLGLFAGLNVLPKATALHDYSYQIGSAPNRAILAGVTKARVDQDPFPTDSFELDFHASGETSVCRAGLLPAAGVCRTPA